MRQNNIENLTSLRHSSAAIGRCQKYSKMSKHSVQNWNITTNVRIVDNSSIRFLDSIRWTMILEKKLWEESFPSKGISPKVTLWNLELEKFSWDSWKIVSSSKSYSSFSSNHFSFENKPGKTVSARVRGIGTWHRSSGDKNKKLYIWLNWESNDTITYLTRPLWVKRPLICVPVISFYNVILNRKSMPTGRVLLLN